MSKFDKVEWIVSDEINRLQILMLERYRSGEKYKKLIPRYQAYEQMLRDIHAVEIGAYEYDGR